MLSNLGDIFREIKADGCVEGIERVIPAYYWLEHHHAGQWSWEYEAFCRLGEVFRPSSIGSMESEVESVKWAYNALCIAHGCAHELIPVEGDEPEEEEYDKYHPVYGKYRDE